jgi:CRISPR system Cascade subunit CasC
MPARFLQFHTLTSYPASLLNRDDAGMAKQIPFGGSSRTRISSQCLKRHWRSHTGDHALATVAGEMGLAVRSREAFRRKVAEPLIAEGLPAATVEAVVGDLMRQALGESAKKEKARKDADGDEDGDAESASPAAKPTIDPLHTGQVVVLGIRELAFIRDLARTIVPTVKDPKKAGDAVKAALGKDGLANLKATAHAGLDAAVFGRMVTSDVLARCDAAIHVAHAFTVHAAQSEADYFSAMDELTRDAGETGAGHINSTDLTTGLFYGYVAVDVGLLISNLGGDAGLAGRTIAALVHLIATVSPGAKLGSTAPHSFSHLLLAEAGSRQPCTLANAFLAPVPTRGKLLQATYESLAQEVAELDANFGAAPERTVMVRGGKISLAGVQPQPLAGVASWCASQVA